MAIFSLLFSNLTPESTGSCHKLHPANEILILAQEVLVGCMLALRVSTLYLFNKRVIMTLIAAVIIGVAVAGWCISSGPPNPTQNISLPGCPTATSMNQCATAVSYPESMLSHLYRNIREF
ncbi:hypothetical protein B0H19DRAFT_1065866 [Mycena capillaripes]|nr:hypothetical protein B0H19DRAFT_1065866 [Mycena capillaripes]